MTDLGTRIAAMKPKAEAAQAAYKEAEEAYVDVDSRHIGNRIREYWEACSPEMFLEMAAWIEELERSEKELKKALEPFDQLNDKLVSTLSDAAYVGGGITYGHLRTAARAYRGEKG